MKVWLILRGRIVGLVLNSWLGSQQWQCTNLYTYLCIYLCNYLCSYLANKNNRNGCYNTNIVNTITVGVQFTLLIIERYFMFLSLQAYLSRMLRVRVFYHIFLNC